jgi:hypothetical protein
MRLTILIASALFVSGCRPPQQETKAPRVGWRPLGSWSGNGNTQTESFNSESGQLRIKWETKNETSPGAGRFKVTAQSAVSGRPIALAVERQGAGRGTAYVTDDPHLFDLLIESSGVDGPLRSRSPLPALPRKSARSRLTLRDPN